MFFFSSSRWDYLSISLRTMNFKTIASFSNILCSFFCHQNAMIWKFLWLYWMSVIFQDCSTSVVVFFLIRIRSFRNFSHEQGFQKCSILEYTPMFFCSSLKCDHFRISLRMINFNNVVLLTTVRCCVCLQQNEVLWEFLWGSSNATIFRHWPMPDGVFLVMRIISF